jgi:hypothetical protein
MAGSISPGKIEAARSRIYDTLSQVCEPTALTEEEQDILLAQACRDACEILCDWADSAEWKALAPSEAFAREPVATAIDGWKQIRPFLEPVRQTLAAIHERQITMPPDQEVTDPSAYIDTMIRAAQYTARRHRRLDRGQLYKDATDKTLDLKDQVCTMAGDLRNDLEEARAGRAADLASEQRRARRRKHAVGLLKIAGNLLLTLSVTLAVTSPAAVRQAVPAWGHDIVALFVHQVAHTAAPHAQVAPPRAGPRVG